MQQKIYFSNKCCCFELSIHESIQKKISNQNFRMISEAVRINLEKTSFGSSRVILLL